MLCSIDSKTICSIDSKTLCTIDKLDVLSHISVDIQNLPILEYITNCFHEDSVHIKTFINSKLS